MVLGVDKLKTFFILISTQFYKLEHFCAFCSFYCFSCRKEGTALLSEVQFPHSATPSFLNNPPDCYNICICGAADPDPFRLIHSIDDRAVTHVQPYMTVIKDQITGKRLLVTHGIPRIDHFISGPRKADAEMCIY